MPGVDADQPVAPPLLRVSEIFSSVQGEGASLGAPCVFLRLALCNLRCSWCDTKYTWDWSQYRYADEVKERPIAEVLRDVRRYLAEQALGAPAEQEGERRTSSPAQSPRLVITGGEPLIQSKALVELLQQLPSDVVVEVETNGTFAPLPELALRVNQWNVSPKLSHGGDPENRRLVDDALLALRDTRRAWLKLVVEAESDWSEIESLLKRTAWPRERVLLMPQASDREALRARLPIVNDIAARQHVQSCSRLHIERWGGRRGV